MSVPHMTSCGYQARLGLYKPPTYTLIFNRSNIYHLGKYACMYVESYIQPWNTDKVNFWPAFSLLVFLIQPIYQSRFYFLLSLNYLHVKHSLHIILGPFWGSHLCSLCPALYLQWNPSITDTLTNLWLVLCPDPAPHKWWGLGMRLTFDMNIHWYIVFQRI